MSDLSPAPDVYTPDRLISGTGEVVRFPITLQAGDLPRGAVLGQIAAGETGAGNFALSAVAATDGSETPSVILDVATDATGGPTATVAIVAGPVNPAALTYGTNHDADTVRWPLRAVGIHLRPTVEA